MEGIYRIVCLKNGKIYIGSSVDIKRRFSIHKSMLKNGKHFNDYLQKSYNKYGIQSFKFDILEIVLDSEDILRIEKNYIDLFNCLTPNGFNIAIDTSAPMKGRRHSKKAREKFKVTNSGKNNPMYGRKHTEESKKKMSIATKKGFTKEKREYFSKLASARIGDKNPFYGKSHSEDAKKKIVANRRDMSGENNPNYGKTLSAERVLEIKKQNSKLKEEQVKEIRQILERDGKRNYRGIGRIFKVSAQVICDIANGKTYTWID